MSTSSNLIALLVGMPVGSVAWLIGYNAVTRRAANSRGASTAAPKSPPPEASPFLRRPSPPDSLRRLWASKDRPAGGNPDVS